MDRRTSRNVRWNKTAIEALPTPAPGRCEAWYHESFPGLCIRVSPTGQRAYYLVRRVGRRQQRILIGKHGPWTPSAALDRAKELGQAIDRGEDPHQERITEKGAPTLADYWRDTFAPQHVARLRPSTRNQYADTFRNHIAPEFGNARLADIKRADVRKFHAGIGATRPRAANLAVAVMRAAINYAIECELFDGPNPCARVKLYGESRRERFLTRQEIARLYQALEADAHATGDWTAHDVCKLALLTGARRGNILAMQWAHLDLDAAQWLIPSAEAKTKRQYCVCLPPGAVAILHQRRRADQTGAFVFPALRRGSKPHLAGIKRDWQRIREAAGLADVRFHDLRHTAASLLANSGTSLQIIGQQLGHAGIATTQRYSHLLQGTVAAAVATAMDGLGEAAPALPGSGSLTSRGAE